MERIVGCTGWLWREQRRAAVRLGVACVVLVVSAPAFAVVEMAGLSTVHVLHPLHTARLRLAAGTYSVDQDPDATGFPVAADTLIIAGQHGTVPTWATPYDISPADLGGTFLGVGNFAQAAKFRISRPGVYRVSVTDPQAGARLFVSEPYSASALRTGPWALAIVAALATLAVTVARVARLRSPRGARRQIRLVGMSPAAAPAEDLVLDEK